MRSLPRRQPKQRVERIRRPSRTTRADDDFEPLGWSDERGPSILNPDELGGPISGESDTIAPLDNMKLGLLPTAGDSIDIAELLSDGRESSVPAPTSTSMDPARDHTASMPDSGEGGWKVRDGRGVVYEFETLSELRQYLTGYPDRSELRVARGIGPFRDIDAFDELAMDNDVDESDIRSKFVDDSAFITAQSMDEHQASFLDTDGPLEPDYRRANRGRREFLQRSQPRTTGSHHPRVSEAVISRDRSFGPPSVMLMIALIYGAGFWFAQDAVPSLDRSARSEPVAQVRSDANDGEKDALVKEAREALDNGKAERAVGLLNAALKKYPDSPEIFLNLALALHQTNRDKEAKNALQTYRTLKGK